MRNPARRTCCRCAMTPSCAVCDCVVYLGWTQRRSGSWVTNFYATSRGRIYLIDVYAKNVKESLTKAEQNALRALVRQLE